MAGLFALSVDTQSYNPEGFMDELCDGIFLQKGAHERQIGFSTKGYTGTTAMRTFYRDEEERIRGKVRRALGPPDGIAYCGKGQGVRRSSLIGWISLCVLAEIINLQQLEHELLDAGHLLVGSRNEIIAETIIHLITGEITVLDGIRVMHKAVAGTYTLLLLAEDGVYVAQSSEVEFPLVIGKKEGAVSVASEREVLELLGFSDLGEVLPGEVLRLRMGIAAKVDVITSVETDIIVTSAEPEESCVM